MKVLDMMNRVLEQIEASNKKQDETGEKQTEMMREQLILMRTEAKKYINMVLTEEGNKKRAAIGEHEQLTKKAAPFSYPI